MNTPTLLTWRRGAAVLLTAVLLLTAAAYALPASAQGTSACPILITMYDTLLVHALPAYGSGLTATLYAGQQTCLIGRTSDAAWVQLRGPVATSTVLGWAPASAFTTTVPLTVLPITYTTTPAPTPTPSPVVTPPVTATTYVVQAGDSLFSIALRYGVTLTALIQANAVQPPAYVIYVGQVLVIPGTSTTTTPPAGYTQYVVKAGDYLVKIARQFNLNWYTLATVNAVTFPYIIHPGQVLLIPASG